jgi:hypothetical protein
VAWQFIVGAGATGITSFCGGGSNFNVGLNIDGWNSSVYIQDQGNIGVGTGAYIGAGLNLSLGNADAPVTGFDAQKYAEADAARLLGVVSAGGRLSAAVAASRPHNLHYVGMPTAQGLRLARLPLRGLFDRDRPASSGTQ